jgi:hypothetical protein
LEHHSFVMTLGLSKLAALNFRLWISATQPKDWTTFPFGSVTEVPVNELVTEGAGAEAETETAEGAIDAVAATTAPHTMDEAGELAIASAWVAESEPVADGAVEEGEADELAITADWAAELDATWEAAGLDACEEAGLDAALEADDWATELDAWDAGRLDAWEAAGLDAGSEAGLETAELWVAAEDWATLATDDRTEEAATDTLEAEAEDVAITLLVLTVELVITLLVFTVELRMAELEVVFAAATLVVGAGSQLIPKPNREKCERASTRRQWRLTEDAHREGISVGNWSGVGEGHQHGGEGCKDSDTHLEGKRLKNKVWFGGEKSGGREAWGWARVRCKESGLEDSREFELVLEKTEARGRGGGDCSHYIDILNTTFPSSCWCD